jgi:hypothetical protein
VIGRFGDKGDSIANPGDSRIPCFVSSDICDVTFERIFLGASIGLINVYFG